MTLKEAIDQWELYALHKLSDRTFRAYRRRLKELLDRLGDVELPLSKTDVAYALGKIESSSVRKQMIASYQSLRSFLMDFADVELPDVPKFVRPKEKEKLPKPIQEETFRKILEVAKERAKEFPWKLSAVILLSFAGLRSSEALSVTPESLEKDENGTVWVRVTGKGNKERRVPMPKNEYTEWLWENRKKVLPLGVSYVALYKTVRHLGKLAGEKDVTPHRLRHTYGTILSARGIPVQVIQELMGIQVRLLQ
jgi:integrase